MFLLFPRKYTVETTLTPSQCRKKLNRELIEYNRKPSLIAANSFIKKHRLECCYFGSWDKSGKFELFYHRAKKHDGSSAGFFGRIEKTESGSRITGKIRRTAAVVVTSALWTAVSLLLILSLIALKEYEGAACTAAVFAVGLGLMIYDGSEKYLKSYLDSFPKSDDLNNSDN
jgi:hypothetical protein